MDRVSALDEDPLHTLKTQGYPITLSAWDKSKKACIVNFGTNLSMGAQSNSTIRLVYDERQMSMGKFSAESVLSVKVQPHYPLLPIMVKLRIVSDKWYRGYLPGLVGMETQPILFEMPEDQIAPRAPRSSQADSKRNADEFDTIPQDYSDSKASEVRQANEYTQLEVKARPQEGFTANAGRGTKKKGRKAIEIHQAPSQAVLPEGLVVIDLMNFSDGVTQFTANGLGAASATTATAINPNKPQP